LNAVLEKRGNITPMVSHVGAAFPHSFFLVFSKAVPCEGKVKMNYNFDRVIDRRNTDSVKYMVVPGMQPGTLPLWVADMDFPAPECVTQALVEKSRHGIFGYSRSGEDYFQALYHWYDRQFGWKVKEEWLIQTPGVVNAVNIALQAFTREGDHVIIQEPVYYPFAGSIRQSGRQVVVSQLSYDDGHYTMDFQDFEKKILDNQVKLYILCNPHNPIGRVWTKEELTQVGEICLRHGVTVVSDEIHQDFVYPGHRHQVFADISPALAEISVTCTAPSKTFNLAGLQISNIFIPNERLRTQYMEEMRRRGYTPPGIMGIVACRAAYTGGEDWLEALKVYLKGNIDFVRGYLASRLPMIRLVEPEGTYLIWLDCAGLGMPGEDLDKFILEKARLWLDGGTMFGAGGDGFQRINIACPRSVLEKALDQLYEAVQGL